MLEFRTEHLGEDKKLNLIIEDKSVEGIIEGFVSPDLPEAIIIKFIESMVDGINKFYIMEKREMAKDIIKEFLRDVPEWIKALDSLKIVACTQCGLKTKKLEELAEAIKILL